jgi:serine/threonine protein kinase/DNA-binding winged helix-turn-helix (wHTH) protein/tetratricopeptide (TPR) repeat protein
VKPTRPSRRFRFGPFEADLKAGELYKNGVRILLSGQPFQLLGMLVEHAGELVTRKEIRRKFWPHGTTVEFDHSINAAMRRLRDLLDDDAEHPVYIETIPRRGYRFIAPVTAVSRPNPTEAPAGSGTLISSHPMVLPSSPIITAQELKADLDDLKDRIVSRYHVLEKLGQGSMGVVYRAEDLKLGRLVALRFLPQSLNSDGRALECFRQEARAASALSHPNICTLYDIDEFNGHPVLVMEFLHGETLKQRITRGVPLARSANQFLDLAIQMASCLEAAHSAGIMHQGIRPASIFITRHGQVKLLDFGLAKLAQAGERRSVFSVPADRLMVAGGTAWKGNRSVRPAVNSPESTKTDEYLAPEQISGDEVDCRADLFSLGVVLHEMITGRPPSQRNALQAVSQLTLDRHPEAFRWLDSRILPPLEGIIRRALERDRDLRYQTARDMLAELRCLKRKLEAEGASLAKIMAPDRGAETETIAVLPFENASGDPDSEYLSDGITESLIHCLSRMRRLKVLARSTVFRCKSQVDNPAETGRKLNVQWVLTGRVLKHGQALIVGTELVDVNSGSQLWGEHYRRDFTDIFAVQEEIARAIFEKLRLKLSSQEEQQLARRDTQNADAYVSYLRGLFFWHKWSAEGLRRAEELFRRAIEEDPACAPAYAGLADCLSAPRYLGLVPPLEAAPKVKQTVETALALDDSLPLAWYVLGISRLLYEWDWIGAEEAFRRAVEVGPDDARGHVGLGYTFAVQGRLIAGLEEMTKATRLDPLSPLWTYGAAMIYHWMGRNAEAREELEKSLEIDPKFLFSRLVLGQVYALTDKLEEAIREFEQAARDAEDHPYALGYLGYACAASGQRAEAEQILARLQELSARKFVPPFAIALVHMGAGEKDLAFHWLSQAVEAREPRMTHLKVDPLLGPFRSDSRFQDLYRRVGLPS